MEPRIQYAQTTDGVSIAYYTIGEGMALVLMPSQPFSHIQLEWQLPEWRRSYEWLAQKRKLVRYDGRGSGLSDRDVTEFPLESHLLDLEAVVDRLGLERFALLGYVDSGPIAITYAARHPERVSHLILWGSYARASDQEQAPETEGLRGLMDQDWHLFTETLAHTMLGWSGGEASRLAAEFMRECTTPEAVQSAWRANSDIDVTAILPQVRSPTLVLHSKQIRWSTEAISRGLASRIPDARLTVVDGISLLGDEAEPVLRAIDEFLSEAEKAASGKPPDAGAFRTVLFTDVEGSTALTERLGDARARELLREHERIVREALKAHGGSEFKTMGDGFMTSFSSATRALECAIAIQRAFAERNASLTAHPEPVEGGVAAHGPTGSPQAAIGKEPIRVRVGLNAGEPIAEDDPDGRSDLYGTAVNEAARITATAKGGEILASDVVRQLVKGKDFLFGDRGETSLKGFDEPVRLFDVRWRE